MIIMVNRIKLLKELEKYPVFNVRIINNIINKDNRYCWLVIHRLKKAGLIYQLERDKYTLQSDSLVVGSHIIWPCYLSSWSAIRYYNLTEQLPNYIDVITTRPTKRKKIAFKNTTINFIRIKKENFFGFEKIRHGDFDIFMAEKEKALTDAIYLKHLSLSTFIEILKEHKKEIKIKKLKQYLKKMGAKGIIGKLEEAGL